MESEYNIGPGDVLRYLKDPTDVRTQHASYGKAQTLKALLSLDKFDEQTESLSLLYRVSKHYLFNAAVKTQF